MSAAATGPLPAAAIYTARTLLTRRWKDSDYPATCWGRVIAASVYHSKVQLKKSGLITIQLKGSHSEFRNVFNHGNSTTNESQRYNSMFFNDIFDCHRPTSRMLSFHEYKKRLPSFNLLHNRYSFVINSFLAAQKCGRDFDRLVELSVISGHISAQIPALADEWVSAIKALCTTNARDREMMGYRELTIDVKDCSNHYPLATFIMLLAGKYAFSVPRLVAELLNHVFPKVMQKDQWNGHNASNYDGEAGVCLALQVLSAISCRKDEPYLVSRHYKGDEDKIKLVPESADEIILAMIHWNEMDNVLFPMLSNICILQDTLRNRHKDLELELPRIVESTWYRKEYLTIIVKTALNVICEEEWVTMKMYDIVQTNNMSAFNCDRLKQNFLGQQLLRLGIRRRSEREIVRELTICNGNSKKALIDKLLSSMNLWNLRATLFDLMLMIKEISPTEITQKVHHASTNAADALMGEIGKCCRDLFTTAYKEGKQLPPATLYKLDKNFRIESISNYWLIASLVKICPQPTNMPLTFTSTTVAGKFLKEAASMLDTANDSSKERIQQSRWLLSQQAVLTSMKCEKDNHNNDSKSLLVGSLFKQLQDMTLKTKENPALPHMDKFASEREGLLLRLSLVGGIFPHICNQAHSESWALLLFQMMLNGVICPDKDRVLYDQQTTTSDGDMKYRWPQYLGVIKKLKKEIAEHPVPPELRHLHQLVPIPKNTLDVLVVEPFGTPLPIPQGGKIPYNAANVRLQQQIKPISGMRHGRLALQPAEKIKVSTYDFQRRFIHYSKNVRFDLDDWKQIRLEARLLASSTAFWRRNVVLQPERCFKTPYILTPSQCSFHAVSKLNKGGEGLAHSLIKHPYDAVRLFNIATVLKKDQLERVARMDNLSPELYKIQCRIIMREIKRGCKFDSFTSSQRLLAATTCSELSRSRLIGQSRWDTSQRLCKVWIIPRPQSKNKVSMVFAVFSEETGSNTRFLVTLFEKR